MEEGLDVVACTLVVRFDAFATLSSYVQSRGRARHMQSLYVLLVERGSEDAGTQLLEKAHTEEQVRETTPA